APDERQRAPIEERARAPADICEREPVLPHRDAALRGRGQLGDAAPAGDEGLARGDDLRRKAARRRALLAATEPIEDAHVRPSWRNAIDRRRRCSEAPSPSSSATKSFARRYLPRATSWSRVCRDPPPGRRRDA